nr:dicarboxylate/amino acid:cation symporter [Estrella lausannensis]
MLFKVFLSMALALAAGVLTGPKATILGILYVDIFGFIGQLFLNALTLVVVPLVAASIITGTAKMSGDHSFGSLGAKTFSLFIGTVTAAVIIGWIVAMMISPGQFLDAGMEPLGQGVQQAVIDLDEKGAFSTLQAIFFKLIPSNILAVASQGQMLGLIFFTLLFGFFLPKIEKGPGEIVLGFWKGLFQVMMCMTHVVMQALPYGVFGLVAKVVATTGTEAIKSIGAFFGTVLVGLAVYSFLFLPVLLSFVGRVNPLRHFKAMGPALLAAFSTSSSAATLPITIECVEKRAGVSNRITSFTLPLATTLNLSGTALYVCVASFFICQAYGVELTFGLQMLVIIMSVLTSFGMAGIPSASLVAIVMILNSAGLPGDGVALILAVERILDMFRTVVNVLGNTCSAVIVARSEGERHVLSH